MKKTKVLFGLMFMYFAGLLFSCKGPLNEPVNDSDTDDTTDDVVETPEEAEKRRQEFLKWIEGTWIEESLYNKGLPENIYTFKVDSGIIVEDLGYNLKNENLNFIKTYYESKDEVDWDADGISKTLVNKDTAFFAFNTSGQYWFLNKINKDKLALCYSYPETGNFKSFILTNKNALKIDDDDNGDNGNDPDDSINITGTWSYSGQFSGFFTFNSDNTWTFSGDKSGQPSSGTYKINNSTLTMEYTLTGNIPVSEDFTIKTVTDTSLTLTSKNQGVSTTFQGYFGVMELEMTFTKQ